MIGVLLCNQRCLLLLTKFCRILRKTNVMMRLRIISRATSANWAKLCRLKKSLLSASRMDQCDSLSWCSSQNPTLCTSRKLYIKKHLVNLESFSPCLSYCTRLSFSLFRSEYFKSSFKAGNVAGSISLICHLFFSLLSQKRITLVLVFSNSMRNEDQATI